MGEGFAIIQTTDVGESEIRLFDGDTLVKKLTFSVYKMGAKAHSSLFSVGGMKATSPVKC